MSRAEQLEKRRGEWHERHREGQGKQPFSVAVQGSPAAPVGCAVWGSGCRQRYKRCFGCAGRSTSNAPGTGAPRALVFRAPSCPPRGGGSPTKGPCRAVIPKRLPEGGQNERNGTERWGGGTGGVALAHSPGTPRRLSWQTPLPTRTRPPPSSAGLAWAGGQGAGLARAGGQGAGLQALAHMYKHTLALSSSARRAARALPG